MLGFAGLFAPSADAAKPRVGKLFSCQMELVSPVMTLPRLALALVLAGLLAAPAQAEDAPIHRHSLSLIGEPKYPAGFDHFGVFDAGAEGEERRDHT